MNAGIIGAGKVGCSLGKYFVYHGLSLSGFFDVDPESARTAADFVGADSEEKLEELVKKSDVLFLTVPDGLITNVWNQIKDLPVEGKFICHCSGALSAEEAFPDIKDRGAFGYSVHPLFAVSDRFHSYKELEHAYFTIEGDEQHLDDVRTMFMSFGNPVRLIQAKDKVKYHCAAAICSNQVIALIQESLDLMADCGFDEESALAALKPLISGNVNKVLESGTVASLTGPVERCDVKTVQKHLDCLNEEDQMLYRLLSKRLTAIGKRKNPSRDYGSLEKMLKAND
ncbi:MAG: DUF2520 domain-containing protein [Clostridiales bacterium]|nr:DUF2520 domain-containing protein [Clostridiales bacterium]